MLESIGSSTSSIDVNYIFENFIEKNAKLYTTDFGYLIPQLVNYYGKLPVTATMTLGPSGNFLELMQDAERNIELSLDMSFKIVVNNTITAILASFPNF